MAPKRKTPQGDPTAFIDAFRKKRGDEPTGAATKPATGGVVGTPSPTPDTPPLASRPGASGGGDGGGDESEGAKKYRAKKERERKRNADASKAGRDIGPLPEVADPRRRRRCERSLRLFCETYLSAQFPLAWSPDHLTAIERIETSILEGGRFAFAMPRGSGKTTLSEAGATWGLVYGHRSFVALIGASEAAAEELLDSIKTELETNDLLADDFPEVCHPIRALEGIANRANGQTLDGERTRIGWTQKELVFPTVKGAKTSGAILKVAGITGRVRGMKVKNADGRSVRPDFVICDDPQTDESARSPTQNNYREGVLSGAVLGLAGPKKKISCVMPCTVIAPGDMADRILDRDRHPEWHGERTKLLPAIPTNEAMWEEYARLRAEGLRAGDGGRAATDFYRANRALMDAGGQAAWPERFNADEISAIQHAMNLKIDNPRAFDAEYQNDPRKDTEEEMEELSPDVVASKLNSVPRGTVGPELSRLTCGIDVQGKVLFWTIAGWDERFGGAIVDYGTFPEQNRAYFAANDARPSLADVFPGMSEEAVIYAGLKALTGQLLTRWFPRGGGGDGLRVERCLIDSGWQTDTVYQFCRHSEHAAVIYPSKGRGIKAGDRPMAEWRRAPGDRIGWNWRIDAPTSGQTRVVSYDANQWKSFVVERLRSAPPSVGCLYLPGKRMYDHQLFADHLCSEYRVRTQGRGRTVEEWKLRPDRPENHWLDTVVLAAVGASVQGLTWSAAAGAGETVRSAEKPKRLKLSEIQAQKRAALRGARGG